MWVDNLILAIALRIYKLRGLPKFKEWIVLEELKEKIIKAVEERSDEFPTHLLSFLSTALHVNSKHFKDAEWTRVVTAFYEICLNTPSVQIPLTAPSAEKHKDEDWDYPERTWHLYSHLLARNYGWSLEYISQLQVGEALAKIQEILTEDQLEREFQHSLSEVAYPYDKSTKMSRYAPLTRPHWMRPKVKDIKKRKMPRVNLPIGEVNYDAIPESIRPQPLVH